MRFFKSFDFRNLTEFLVNLTNLMKSSFEKARNSPIIHNQFCAEPEARIWRNYVFGDATSRLSGSLLIREGKGKLLKLIILFLKRYSSNGKNYHIKCTFPQRQNIG